MNGINILRAVIILTILLMFINAKDYFLSFSFINVNGKIIYANFNCSRALSYKNSPKKYLFSIPLYKDIKTTCKIYKERIIDNLLKQKIFIYSNEKLFKNNLTSRIKLIFLPKRFDIIIKNGFVKFYLKE